MHKENYFSLNPMKSQKALTRNSSIRNINISKVTTPPCPCLNFSLCLECPLFPLPSTVKPEVKVSPPVLELASPSCVHHFSHLCSVF